VASLASTIAGFPLDSVKSRLQVKRYVADSLSWKLLLSFAHFRWSRYSSVLDCVTKTYADEGVKGFFRGVTIPLVSITAVRTASFSIYSGVKEQLRSRQIITGHDVSSTAASAFIGGASSGIMLSIGTSAFEFAKIRSQLESIIAYVIVHL
jgi:solute carrier family 25 carnitine/acylcarnitine transporter 20/29